MRKTQLREQLCDDVVGAVAAANPHTRGAGDNLHTRCRTRAKLDVGMARLTERRRACAQPQSNGNTSILAASQNPTHGVQS